MSNKIPTVQVLESITPSNAGTGDPILRYDGLQAAADTYAQTSSIRAARVWDSEPGSVEESAKARQLASEHLVRTAERAVDSEKPQDRALWAGRFTKASIELYGQPEAGEVHRLLGAELNWLAGLADNEDVSQDKRAFLLGLIEPVAGSFAGKGGVNERQFNKEQLAVQAYGEMLHERYEPLLAIANATGKTHLSGAELRGVFQKSITWLQKNEDKQWKNWQVINGTGSNVVVVKNGLIKIPDDREDIAVEEVPQLIAHELLTHAQRYKNGGKLEDDRLSKSLPGYERVEEGLAILTEYAVSGHMPDKAVDRYVDIAWALGTVDGKQRTRHELFDISFARQLIRAQAKGKLSDDDVQKLQTQVWMHVDRIYRGGRGDVSTARQAVFTKDITYYAGYPSVLNYFAKELAEGKTAEQIYQFVMQAKFDFEDPKHITRLEQAKRNSTTRQKLIIILLNDSGASF